MLSAVARLIEYRNKNKWSETICKVGDVTRKVKTNRLENHRNATTKRGARTHDFSYCITLRSLEECCMCTYLVNFQLSFHFWHPKVYLGIEQWRVLEYSLPVRSVIASIITREIPKLIANVWNIPVHDSSNVEEMRKLVFATAQKMLMIYFQMGFPFSITLNSFVVLLKWCQQLSMWVFLKNSIVSPRIEIFPI